MTPQPHNVTDKALIALSAAPDKLEIVIDGDIARCPNCTRPIGQVEGHNLIAGEFLIIPRGVGRCRSCKRKIIFIPKPLTSAIS